MPTRCVKQTDYRLFALARKGPKVMQYIFLYYVRLRAGGDCAAKGGDAYLPVLPAVPAPHCPPG